MNVELIPSPEFTINLRVLLEVRVLCLYGVRDRLQETIRCVDPGAFARTRLVAIPEANTYEWQLQLENTIHPPEDLLADVRDRVQGLACSDEHAYTRGKVRNIRNALPPVPRLLPRLF